MAPCVCLRRWNEKWAHLCLSRCTPAYDPVPVLPPPPGCSSCSDLQEPTGPFRRILYPPGVLCCFQAGCHAQRLTSFQGTEIKKSRSQFDPSVVNYSLCIRLEDSRANKKNLWVQRRGGHRRRGQAGKGAVPGQGQSGGRVSWVVAARDLFATKQ